MTITKKGRRWILCCRVDDVDEPSPIDNCPEFWSQQTQTQKISLLSRIRNYLRAHCPSRVQVKIRKMNKPGSTRVLFQFSPFGGDFTDTVIGVHDNVESADESNDVGPVAGSERNIKDALSSIELQDNSLPELPELLNVSYHVHKRDFEVESSDDDMEMLVSSMKNQTGQFIRKDKTEQVNKAKDIEQVSKDDEKEQVSKANDVEQVNKAKDIEQVNKAKDIEQVSKDDEKEHVSKKYKTEQVNKRDEREQVSKANDVEKVGKDDEMEKVSKRDETKQTSKKDKSEQVSKADNPSKRVAMEPVHTNGMAIKRAQMEQASKDDDIFERDEIERQVKPGRYLSEVMNETAEPQYEQKLRTKSGTEKKFELSSKNPEIELEQDGCISETNDMDGGHNTNAFDENSKKKGKERRRVSFNEKSIVESSWQSLKRDESDDKIEAVSQDLVQTAEKSVKRISSKKHARSTSRENLKREKRAKKVKAKKASIIDASEKSANESLPKDKRDIHNLNRDIDASLDSQASVMTGEQHVNKEERKSRSRSKNKSKQGNAESPGRMISTDRNTDLMETPWSSIDQLPRIEKSVTRKSRKDDLAGASDKGNIKSRHAKNDSNNYYSKYENVSHHQQREITLQKTKKRTKSPTNLELDQSCCSDTVKIKLWEYGQHKSDKPVIQEEGCKERQKKLLQKIYDEVHVNLKPTHSEVKRPGSRETNESKTGNGMADREIDRVGAKNQTVVLPKPNSDCLKDKETDLRKIKSSDRWKDSCDNLVGHKPQSDPTLETESQKKKKRRRKKSQDLNLSTDADKTSAIEVTSNEKALEDYPSRLSPDARRKCSVDRLAPIKNMHYSGIQCTVRVKDYPPPTARCWTNIAPGNNTDNLIPVEIVTDINDRRKFPLKKASWG